MSGGSLRAGIALITVSFAQRQRLLKVADDTRSLRVLLDSEFANDRRGPSLGRNCEGSIITPLRRE
jgi:hypothetical protein